MGYTGQSLSTAKDARVQGVQDTLISLLDSIQQAQQETFAVLTKITPQPCGDSASTDAPDPGTVLVLAINRLRRLNCQAHDIRDWVQTIANQF